MLPPKVQIVWKTAHYSVMKFDHSNKFDLCYYGQVNSLRLKSSVASKWAGKHFCGVTFILLAMIHKQENKKRLLEKETQSLSNDSVRACKKEKLQ